MRRRDFITLALGAVTWPRVACAQQPTKVYRIFWVSSESQPDPFLDGFREGLRERGYAEGKDVVFELYYSAGDPDELRQVISALKRGNIDLAVSSGPATRVLMDVTEVPVLFALSGDPVELGIVKSLGQPGGNFTGTSFLSLELAGKRVELLKDIFPKLRTLAVLSNTDHPGEPSGWQTTQQTTHALGMDPVYVSFFGAREFDKALEAASKVRADAMLVFPDAVTMARRTKLAEFAISGRLPSMFGWSEYCDAGGLMSYGANQRATYVRLATYADRILHGEKPANLPVERPTKFELAVNLRTARALGVEGAISSILFRANKVIE
jgi:putative tryptophan/tyrosine transport system substrate-binding protein